MTEHTKGKATAEIWCNPKTDPRWIIKLGGEIRFQTVGANDEANAKAFIPRWNSHDALLAALKGLCKKYIQNRGTTCEFISCITPEGIPSYWIKAEQAIAEAERE